jgi:hypothetical protein
MTEQVRVVDGDAPERTTAVPPGSNWLLFALGFAVGLGVAVVFLTSTGVNSPTATTTDVVAIPTTPEVADTEIPGIGELVEGFPDALVAMVELEGRSLTHLLWPVGGPPVERPLPAGGIGMARFDSSGRWFAATTLVPDQEGSVLSVGIASSFPPLVSGVTSFAWHDSQSGELAYTRVSEGAGSLWVVHANRRPVQVVGRLDPLVRVSAWGEWGFVVWNPVSNQMTLYNPGGEHRAVLDGAAYGSHPSGWIVASDGELMLVSAGGGVSRLGTDMDNVGAVMNAEFSPDRSLIAVRGDHGLLVVDAGDGSVLRTVRVPGDNPDLTWSSDSRFVALVHFRGVVVVDAFTAEMTTVLGSRSVEAVGVIPLTGS